MRSRGFNSLGDCLWLEITGMHAVTFGLLVTCVGVFIHFQWFWGNHKRLLRYYEIGKYASLVGVIFAMIAHAYTMITRT